MVALSLVMDPSFRRLVVRVVIWLGVPLLLTTIVGSQTSDPIILSEQETKTIAELLKKNQIRFDDAKETVYVDPGLWYAVDVQQKKNLTILLARNLAAKNRADFSPIKVLSAITRRRLATYTMFEGFTIGE